MVSKILRLSLKIKHRVLCGEHKRDKNDNTNGSNKINKPLMFPIYIFIRLFTTGLSRGNFSRF